MSNDWFTFTTTTRTLTELLGRDSPSRLRHAEFAKRSGQVREIALRTSPAPGSLGKTWEEHQELLRPGEWIPSARDVVEAIYVYYGQTRVMLFQEAAVRTSDSASGRFLLWRWKGRAEVRSYWDLNTELSNVWQADMSERGVIVGINDRDGGRYPSLGLAVCRSA